ncbi:MAG: 30S ribosomal protein S1 [Bacteroidales bacterium]
MTDELNVNPDVEENEEPTNQVEEQIEAQAEVNEELASEAKEEAIATAENIAVAEAEVETVEAEVIAVVAEVTEEVIPQIPTKPRYVKEVISLEDFDWDAIGKKTLNYSSDERKKLEEVYDKTFSQIVEQEVVEGIVVAKNNREVVVNIGFKSDGVIPVSEVRYNANLKIGDTIEVYVESQEDANGQLILSHKKARLLKSWDRVNKAFETQEIITGYVKCRTKGGLIVDVFGIEAFLPGSQIDVKPIRDYDVFVEKNMEFKVVKINHEYKNVVVSHKALIEDEIEQQKAEIIAKLEKGQVLEGTVKNITSYGVFIDLGGVDGLVHITDLSWGRINHPEEIVTLDEKINVVILDFDENKKRIALGLKQLTPHPWDALDANLAVGDKIKGKVVVIADYGAFMEIVPGVEGLIHVSEMSWSQHLRTAHDFLKIGNEVEAVILTLDREERKMSLGIKQLIPDPWTNIADKYPLKSKHTAIVRNFTNFGIFVELEEGVDGLIHISDLSWSKKIKHPAEFTKIGDSIEVIVLEVDSENRRLSLGHKQLEENPWEIFETVFTVDSIHKGTIVSSSDKGAIIALPYGVEGFAPLRHLVKEDGSNAKTDETIDFKVLEFSKDSKKIIVSHSKINQDASNDEKSKADSESKRKERDQKKSVKQNNDNLERSTLGDIEALSNLKSEMQKSEMEKLDAMTKREQDKKVKKPKEVAPEVEVKSEVEATIQEEIAPEQEATPDVEATNE